MTCQRSGLSGKLKAEFGQGLLDRCFLSGADVAEQQVLIGGQADLQLIGLHNLAQPVFHCTLQSSAHHRQTDEPETFFLPVPAEVVLKFRHRFLPDAFQVSFEIVLAQCRSEPGDPPLMEEVFHAGVLPHFTISVIPLQGHDRLKQIKNIRRLHVAERIGRSGKGVFLVMGAAHATAHVDIAAFQDS